MYYFITRERSVEQYLVEYMISEETTLGSEKHSGGLRE